jgi:enoyl-CoA hydratase
MSDLKHLLVERDEELAIVTVNRPEKMNALNAEVVGELGVVFDRLGADESVRGIILTGAGEKSFVAGADISELAKMDGLEAVAISERGQGVLRRIERCPKPVLAAVGGYALGGGCELAIACHLRIASKNARFGLPEVGLGILPGYGGTVRLARLVGLGRAVEMTLTGDPIDAERAEAIGLVSRVVERDELLDEARALLRRITSKGPVAVRLAMESVYHATEVASEEALRHEAALFGVAAGTDDMREGMTAFLEKRKPEFKGR